MNVIFADTSYYIALLSLSDERHMQAEKLADEFTGLIITTDWVLLELANFFSDASVRRVFIRFESTIRMLSFVEVVPVDRDHFDRGMKLFLTRTDKSWSLVDCISFIVMQERGIHEAWTSDRHFVQAGFKSLLI